MSGSQPWFRFYNYEMKYVVAYDISKDEVRNKVCRFLSKFGYRIQLSVFYLPDVSEREVDLIVREIRGMVNPRRDRVFFYPVQEIEVFEGYPIEPWEVEVV